MKKYSVEKFTIELCHDKYFDMIPNSYLTPNNKALAVIAGAFDCIEILKKAKKKEKIKRKN